ncbi:MAG: carbohydrate binding domain-containing protein, partial [Clostridiales Family XIII bacterium]|nr:carbohydrate binding domain-containing protein [Clostridiales Family XIII bacterium]
MYHNKNPLMRGKASKPMVGILIFALLIPFIPCVPGTPLSGAVYAADGRTDQIGGNLIQNAEFEEDAHIQTDAAAGKWFPNYSGPLTRDTAYSHAGTYSLKVSGRTETYHSAVYRIAGSDLVPGKDYDLGGFAYAVNNTDMLFGMEIIYWNASEGWRSAFITLNAWKTVTGGNWSEFATTLRLARATTDVGNEYAYTLTYGGQTQDFRGVDNFLLNFYFNTAGTDDFWIDSFLLKQTAAPPPSGHANAPNPANDPDNIFNNASVEADDFSAGMTTGKWYPNGATLARDTSYSHSGAASLRVSGRNLFWHRAEYNVEPGKFAQNKNHQLSCYASSLEAARAELRVEVFGYGGGGDGNGYPSASVVWPAVDTAPGQWAALGGTFKVKQVANADEGFYDLEITHDASGLASPLTVTHVKGLSSVRIYVQEAYGEATPRTDLYLDSFLLKPEVAAPPSGHANAPNPADDPENMINNASFENEGNFGTPAAAAAGTWYPSASGPTVARDDTYSHSGAHSLKMTGRTTGAQSPRYKINGADLMLGKKYDVSGFIGVPDDTRALMGMQILAWDSVIYWKSATVNLSLWREVKRADGWTEFSSELMLTREPTATAGDYEYTLTYGRATHKFLAADGNLSLQLYFNTEDTNDLWLDSFLLKPKSGEIPDRPTGIGSYGDTQDTQGNLIQNASFEDDDFAADWGTHDKWYTLPGVGTLARLTDYSHGGSGSLRIGDRVNSSVSAWKSINGSQISLLKDYNISGYVSAREALNAQLSIEVYGYGGGLLGDAYPNGLMRFPPVGTGTGGWDRIGGSFRITSAPNAEHPGKFDLTVTYGPEGFDSPPPFPLSEPASFSILSPVLAQLNEMSALAAAEDLPSFKLVNVHGLSEIRILVGEADESKHLRPDMYADSFLLEEVDRPAPKKPGGHTGAPNPEDDAGNMFRNASIEANDFASDYAVDKWYPAAAGVTLRQVTTYSHSGTASLLVSGRDAFWHRAPYNVEGYRFASGRDYQVSAYASSLENTRAELMIEVFGYGGTEQGNPYPSQWITLSAGDTAPGAWTKLSGAFNIKQSPTS